jgi:hypothetical protein
VLQFDGEWRMLAVEQLPAFFGSGSGQPSSPGMASGVPLSPSLLKSNGHWAQTVPTIPLLPWAPSDRA